MLYLQASLSPSASLLLTQSLFVFFLASPSPIKVAWKSEQEYTFSVGPKENTATLTGLQPNTVYKVRVFAQNLLGKSPASDDLVVRTEEEGK